MASVTHRIVSSFVSLVALLVMVMKTIRAGVTSGRPESWPDRQRGVAAHGAPPGRVFLLQVGELLAARGGHR